MNAVLNAYIKPVMASYLAELEAFLAKRLRQARLLVARSGGGTMSASEARRFPVHTLLSGPRPASRRPDSSDEAPTAPSC
jgi:N-methylhydantoinase A